MAMDLSSLGGAGAVGAIMAIIAGMLAVFLVIGIILWVYMGFAFTAIGKKAKVRYPALAWIPGIGPALVAFNASGMHWWPWLLLLITAIPYIGSIASLAFSVYSIIWMWKMFEEINKPGWWAILMLIPIVNLVVIGMAAWGKK